MDKLSREILQKTMRYLSLKGYKVLSEFALPNKKRVDIIAINLKKEIIIVEVKSNKNDIKLDKKWKNYLNYCNYFYFACNDKLKNFNFFIYMFHFYFQKRFFSIFIYIYIFIFKT